MDDDNEISNYIDIKDEELEIEMENSPHNIELGLSLLLKYTQTQQQQKLQNLRKKLQQYFILPEFIWLDWVNENKQQMQDNQKKDLLNFISNSLDDGLYNILGKQYLLLGIKFYQDQIIKINQIDVIFEKLVSKFGYDFNNGSQYFKLYIKFYEDLLRNTDDQSHILRYQNKIKHTYERQLSFPLVDIDETLQKYFQNNTFIEKNDKQKAKQIYEVTYKVIEQTFNYQDKIDQLLEQDQMELLLKFLKESQQDLQQITDKNLKYTLIQQMKIFFERIILEFPHQQKILEEYLKFTIIYVQNKNQEKQLVKLALRHCPNHIEFLKHFFRNLEKEEIEINEYEEKISFYINIQPNQEDQFQLMQILCEFQIRCVNQQLIANKKSLNDFLISNMLIISKTRNSLQSVLNFLSILENAEQVDQIYYLYSCFETFILKQEDKLVEVMEKYVHVRGECVHAWRLYIKCLMAFSQVGKSRSAFKRAAEYVKDDPQAIFNDWVSFERLYGSIQQIEQAEHKYTINQSKQSQEQQQEQEQQQQQFLQQQEVIDDPRKKVKDEMGHNSRVRQESGRTVFIKNLPLDLKEEQLVQALGNGEEIVSIRVVKDHLGYSRGFAYVDYRTEEEAGKAVKGEPLEIKGRRLYIALSRPPVQINDRTLVMSNLPFDLTEDEFRQALQLDSKIEEVRLARNQQGRPKGYAYVQFTSPDVMMEAFESLYKNVLVKGRQLDIREVEPKQESDTVLIKNLDFLTTEREIKYFLKQSKIDYKELNFVVNKRGKSKGFCFIQLNQIEQVTSLLSLKDKQIRGRQVIILRSNRKWTKEGKKENVRENEGMEEEKEEEKEKEKEDEKREEENVNKDNEYFRRFLS